MTVEIREKDILVTLGKRRASIPATREPDGEDGPDLLVYLDELIHWDPPEQAEISLDDLAKLTEIIERYCDRNGLEVEFE